MEANTQRRLVGLRDKIPDIQKTLDTVDFLKARKVSPPRMEGRVVVVMGGGVNMNELMN